ncbi:MAG: hypothetical protein COV74_07845 [Candidatus Omnitrophica bacterium CG11_big_fil_rev_8_21_14_0_20_45_26]|uniref:fructose-bisphosphate aldolase n=1 Tax=Candidatus Abzuiibacterium crystallinum TaxID=1974748 RepID=A0A2H0LPJ3_9BACT|nr:MAG: hypothetical protein COV74_07845 [Candidatus Omnitrophica bacterium CG11_big_fil_rev_8_21_14_0_20_45_26]PIW65135.1 MAG: hypothetical protein COW12_02885 [Candidatus Omnitrophica bacterium CG12_big_fil_rev_8_21_14_0_65_45_16]
MKFTSQLSKITSIATIFTFVLSSPVTYSSSFLSSELISTNQAHLRPEPAAGSPVAGELDQFANQFGGRVPVGTHSELRKADKLEIRDDAKAGELARLWGEKTINGKTFDVEETILWLAEHIVGDVAEALVNWQTMEKKANELIAKGATPEEAFGFLAANFPAKTLDANGKVVTKTAGEIYEGGINNFLRAMGEDVPVSEHSWAMNETVDASPRSKNRGLVITGPADKFDMLASQTNGANYGLSSSLQDFEDAAPEMSGRDLWLQQLNLYKLYAGQFEGGKPYVHPTKKYTATDPEVKSGAKKVGDPKVYTMKVGLDKAPAPFDRLPGLHLSIPSVTINGKRIPAFIAAMTVFLLNNYDNLKDNGFDVGFYIAKSRWPQDLFVWEKAAFLMEQKIGVPQGTIKFKVMHEQAPFSLSQFVNMWVVKSRTLITNVGRWDQNASFIRMFKWVKSIFIKALNRVKSMLFPDQRFAGMLTLRMTYYTSRNAFFNVLVGVIAETAKKIDPEKPVQLVEMTNALAEGGMAVQLKNNVKPDDTQEIAAEKLRLNANAISDIRIDKIRERLLGLFMFNKANGQKILLDSTRESWVATTDPEYVKAGAEPLRVELNSNGSTLEEIVAPLQAYVDANVTPKMREKFIELGILGDGGKIKPTEFSATDLTKEKIDSVENWRRLMMPSEGDRTIEGLAQEIFFTFDYNGQQVAGNNAAAVENPLDGNGWLGILQANFTGNRIMSDHATNEGNLNGLYVTLFHGQQFTKDGKFVDLTGTYPDLEVKAGDVITPDLVYQLWLRLKVFTEKRLDNFEAKKIPVNRPVANLVMETVKRILIKTDENGNPIDANGKIIPENGTGRVIQPVQDIPYASRILYTLNELYRTNRLGEANRVLTAIFTEDRNVLVEAVERARRQHVNTKAAKYDLEIYDYVHDVFDPSEAFGISRSELRNLDVIASPGRGEAISEPGLLRRFAPRKDGETSRAELRTQRLQDYPITVRYTGGSKTFTPTDSLLEVARTLAQRLPGIDVRQNETIVEIQVYGTIFPTASFKTVASDTMTLADGIAQVLRKSGISGTAPKEPANPAKVAILLSENGGKVDITISNPKRTRAELRSARPDDQDHFDKVIKPALEKIAAFFDTYLAKPETPKPQMSEMMHYAEAIGIVTANSNGNPVIGSFFHRVLSEQFNPARDQELLKAAKTEFDKLRKEIIKTARAELRSGLREQLHQTALEMVPVNGGILAADESTGSAKNRLDMVGLENNPENRQAMRQLMLTVPGQKEAGISAVILFSETFDNVDSEGNNLVAMHLIQRGIVPGIKTDKGLVEDPDSPGEMLPNPKGMAELPAMLATFKAKGAQFTKWRITQTIDVANGLPTDENIRKNAVVLAQSAKITQEAGLVPIVEPEVLLDGAHDIQASYDATTRTLAILFEELAKAGVWLDGLVLKTSMILSGNKAADRADPDTVGFETLKGLLKTVPAEVPAIVFLSGGQGDDEVVKNLDGVIRAGQNRLEEAVAAAVTELENEGNRDQAAKLWSYTRAPWEISYSFGRGLQRPGLLAWQGKSANFEAAQDVLRETAQATQAARLGKLEEWSQRSELRVNTHERVDKKLAYHHLDDGKPFVWRTDAPGAEHQVIELNPHDFDKNHGVLVLIRGLEPGRNGHSFVNAAIVMSGRRRGGSSAIIDHPLFVSPANLSPIYDAANGWGYGSFWDSTNLNIRDSRDKGVRDETLHLFTVVRDREQRISAIQIKGETVFKFHPNVEIRIVALDETVTAELLQKLYRSFPDRKFEFSNRAEVSLRQQITGIYAQAQEPVGARAELREQFETLDEAAGIPEQALADLRTEITALKALPVQSVNPAAFNQVLAEQSEVVSANHGIARANTKTVEARIILPKLTSAALDIARETVAAQEGRPTIFIAETAQHAGALRAIFNGVLPANVEIIAADDELRGLRDFLSTHQVTHVEGIGLGGVDRGVANKLNANLNLPFRVFIVSSVEEFANSLHILMNQIQTAVANKTAVAIAA